MTFNVASLVCDNLNVWTTAIEYKSGAGRGNGKRMRLYGVERLRALILDLAMRGKLVIQDQRDEPAAELLKRVAKARDLVAGKRRDKAENSVPLAARDLPAGWAVVRLDELANSQAGFAFKSGGFNGQGIGLPLIRIRDVGQPFTGTYFSGEYREEFVVRRGDYLISMDGEFRVATWEGEPALLNQRVSRLQFYTEELEARFIAIELQTGLSKLQGVKAYTTVDHLSGRQIAETRISLPPLAEQQRIVAKVDELMVLCDELEAESAAAMAAHPALVEALLATLTASTDAADLALNWAGLEAHFDTLFTTKPSVEALKQTILELAVRGKLVPQDANDEPASVTLKAVRKSGSDRSSKQKSHASIPDTDQPFDLPEGWCWERFDNLIDPAFPIAYGVLVPGNDQPDGVPFVRIADLSITDPSPLPEKAISPAVDAQFPRTRLRGGEILMGVVGSIGKLGVAPDSWAGANIARAICRIVPSPLLDKDYVLWLLQSRFMQDSFLGDTRTLAQPTLNIGLIRLAATPVPPFAEQRRIVAKLDELMALCDTFLIGLADASATQIKLADTIVERAVE